MQEIADGFFRESRTISNPLRTTEPCTHRPTLSSSHRPPRLHHSPPPKRFPSHNTTKQKLTLGCLVGGKRHGGGDQAEEGNDLEGLHGYDRIGDSGSGLLWSTAQHNKIAVCSTMLRRACVGTGTKVTFVEVISIACPPPAGPESGQTE